MLLLPSLEHLPTILQGVVFRGVGLWAGGFRQHGMRHVKEGHQCCLIYVCFLRGTKGPHLLTSLESLTVDTQSCLMSAKCLQPSNLLENHWPVYKISFF
ncbi:hypothetical protein Mapa_000227 [Marchantia paleacea]|nr:hypothetical protein Mapa_000227 [Marchantia paleacea]